MAIYSRSSVQNFGGSGLGKTNTLRTLINEQNDIDNFFLYARDLNEPKYNILIKKGKDAGIKHLNDPKAFIECSNMMDDVYENMVIIQAENKTN